MRFVIFINRNQAVRSVDGYKLHTIRGNVCLLSAFENVLGYRVLNGLLAAAKACDYDSAKIKASK